MMTSLQFPHCQTTIARTAKVSGVGIHSGRPIRLRLRPAPEGTGIRFRCLDVEGLEIPALASEICSLELATTLGREGATISTVEHLMAALRIAGVDNLIVEINGPEVPILDGSALPFLRLLDSAGLRRQRAPRRCLAVTAPLTVQQGDKLIRVSPFPGLRVSYTIDFPTPAIGRQHIDLVVDRESFERELAPARTFALLADVERLRQRGLGLGGATDNCVVFSDGGPANTTLRVPDEPVRHKALDAIGDLALAGAPLQAHVEVERGGHQLHCALVSALRERPDCWSWVETEAPRVVVPAPDRRPVAFPGLAVAGARG